LHEFSIASNILERVLEAAQAHGGRPVRRVVLEIGALQGVSVEALAFAFDAAKMDTLAEQAQLEWVEVAARVECSACAEVFSPLDIFWVCPKCGAYGGKVLEGDQLLLTSLELED
jgi:hydrogenase nickel incorporation protein HypA/HybF